MRYADILREYPYENEITPVLDPKKVATAAAAGFDTDTLWFHGTRRKFSAFRLPKKDGINELGKGIYVTKFVGTANAWAQGNGFVLCCALPKGAKLLEMSKMPASQIWDSGPERDDKWANPYWRDAYRGYAIRMNRDFSIPGHEAALPYREWAEAINKGKIDLSSCLSEVGYIGITNQHSQIRGQALIWNPENVRIIGKGAGYDGFVHSTPYDQSEEN